MSIVAHPSLHAPFRDPAVDLFAPSGAASSHAEFPPILDHPSSSLRPPFPIFQHRHTSPYPMTFSALGAPEDLPQALHAVQPPSAPKPQHAPLPRTRTRSPPPTASGSSTAPPPHEREREARRHRPEAMVKLAPPADDGYEAVRGIRTEGDSETPRRSPGVNLDLNNMDTSPSTSVSRSNSEGKRKKRTEAEMAKRRSMGPPARPVRANTAYPASTPSSVRMEPSRSADSRARVRAGMPPRSNTFSPYAVPFPTSAGGSKSSGDLSTPPQREHVSTSSGDGESPDLGGPEGLEAKVVLLGSQGVGKTSLILRYTTRIFTPSAAPATIGSSLHTRKLVHDGTRVKLQIWDTAGQERFRSMAPIYYRGAHVCVLVYDISDRQSFEDVRSWLEELGRTVPKETVIYVVGSKVDLERKRAVTLDEARTSINNWSKPPAPPPVLLSPPPHRSLFRSSSTSNRLEPGSSSTPSRSHSHGALAAYEAPVSRSTTPSAAPTPARIPSSGILTNGAPGPQPLTSALSSPAPVPIPRVRPPSALRIIAASPKSPRRVAFPTLQSPTLSITGTTTEHVNSSIIPSSPTHGVSGGRFSISGVLGMSRTESMSGAILNLSKLAEDYPVDRPDTSTSRLSPPQMPVRVRTESTPLLAGPSQASSRRKSEDWSSRSWRMGGGPGAAEALGEFGASIKKKESEELLNSQGAVGRRGSSGSGMSFSALTAGHVSDDSSSSKEGQATTKIVRSRGGSLGRDSRLYPSSEEEDSEWGVEVGGVRLGECSSLSGVGVEALFKSISSLLVRKKDKIERERRLRRKGSVMLVDPARDPLAQAGNKGRFGCCA